MVQKWNNIFNELMNLPKTVKVWKTNKESGKISPIDVFFESLGNYGKDFVAYCNTSNQKEKEIFKNRIKNISKTGNWKSKTKSSVYHYLSFFPEDRCLIELGRIINE